MQCISVDLPEPDGPMIAVSRLVGISTVTSSSAAHRGVAASVDLGGGLGASRRDRRCEGVRRHGCISVVGSGSQRDGTRRRRRPSCGGTSPLPPSGVRRRLSSVPRLLPREYATVTTGEGCHRGVGVRTLNPMSRAELDRGRAPPGPHPRARRRRSWCSSSASSRSGSPRSRPGTRTAATSASPASCCSGSVRLALPFRHRHPVGVLAFVAGDDLGVRIARLPRGPDLPGAAHRVRPDRAHRSPPGRDRRAWSSGSSAFPWLGYVIGREPAPPWGEVVGLGRVADRAAQRDRARAQPARPGPGRRAHATPRSCGAARPTSGCASRGSCTTRSRTTCR